jgi:uncharacterized protein YlxW (UPF0749 family)
MLNGKTKVEGPGILMTIDDRNAYDKITSSDLQDIVNVLRYSGAEAISINNQRIIANTPISEAGKNMLINKTPVNTNDGITYEIKVIGDSEKLERLVKITNNLVSDLIDLKGVKFTVIQEKKVIIPAYLGGYIYDQAKPASTAKK